MQVCGTYVLYHTRVALSTRMARVYVVRDTGRLALSALALMLVTYCHFLKNLFVYPPYIGGWAKSKIFTLEWACFGRRKVDGRVIYPHATGVLGGKIVDE